MPSVYAHYYFADKCVDKFPEELKRIVENNRKFAVEIKSVNHRYLDINIRIPKALSRTLLQNFCRDG